MPATYEIKNGSTYKILALDKVSCVIKLTASDGTVKEFIHEIESEVPGTEITAERINAVANQLALDFDADHSFVMPNPVITFNTPIEAVVPTP